MLRGTIVLLLAVGLTACSEQLPFEEKAKQKADNVLDSANAEEAFILSQYPTLAKRNGDLLVINVPGDYSTYKDQSLEKCEKETPIEVRDGIRSQDIGSCVEYYRVAGFWPEKYWILVRGLYFEGGTFAVLNASGTQTMIGVRPIVSPDRRKMLTYSSGCPDASADIEIWNTEGDTPVSFETKDIGNGTISIQGVRWDSNRRISVDVADCFDEKPTVTVFLEEHEGNLWRWVENDAWRQFQVSRE